jgi:hypothetical protein
MDDLTSFVGYQVTHGEGSGGRRGGGNGPGGCGCFPAILVFTGAIIIGLLWGLIHPG